MRKASILIVGPIALLLAACPLARAQEEEGESEFDVPPGSLAYEDSGTIEAVQSDVIRIQDSKNEIWMINIVPQTKITVEGEASVDCLRPGTFVQFTAELDKKGMLKQPVEAFEIFSAHGKNSLGLFPTGGSSQKPARGVAAGTYLVKGKLATFRDGEFAVVAGRTKLSGKTADELKVTLSLDDPSLAQAGDTVKVKAWYYDRAKPNTAFNRPGIARAEELTIEMAKPLESSGKKIHQAGKPARPASRSGKVSK